MSNPLLKQYAAMLDALLAPPGPQDAKAKTRARVLQAATRLFQEHGYRRTSVDEVAREAGVAKGTVYVHFKDKGDLLLNAILEEKKHLARPFRPLLEEGLDPTERLEKYLELMFITVHDAPLSKRLVSGDREMLLFLQDLQPEVRAGIERDQSAAFRVLLEGVGDWDRLSEEERDRRAQVLGSLMYSAGVLSDARLRGGLTLEEHARQLARMIVRGICAP